MGRIGSLVVSKVEEGEISDSESVEEITKQDFVKDSGYSRARADGGGCWIKYPAGYASTLANYAWLQAVKNKPLTDPCPSVGRMASAPAPAAATVIETVILDSGDEDEKEEGELEEGEINGDDSGGENPSEIVVNESSEEDVVAAQVAQVESESDKMAEDFELLKKTKSVEEVFVTLIETKGVDKSFRLNCSEARTSLDTLQQLATENRVPVVDELVQKAFPVVQSVYSGFCARTSEQQQLLEDDLLWFFCHVKEKTRALFSQKQMDEVESMIKSVVSNSCKTITSNKTTESISRENSFAPSNLAGATSSLQNPVVDDNFCRGGRTITEGLRREQTFANTKCRRELGPLLNLHIDYDESSLPSPTRANPSSLSVMKPQNDTDKLISVNIAISTEDDRLEEDVQHAYVTDAVKAVSSYQQKFGRTSYIMTDRLPSPTPSEECDEEGSDPHEEVSSICSSSSGMAINSALPSPQVQVSVGSDIININGQETSPVQRPGLAGSSMCSTVKTLAKSRDPRLKLLSSQADCCLVADKNIQVESNSATKAVRGGLLASRKLAAVDDIVPNVNDLKRPRNGRTDPSNPRDPRLAGRGSGWLVDSSSNMQTASSQQMMQSMDIDIQKSLNVDFTSSKGIGNGDSLNSSSNASLPVDGASLSEVSLPSLLKEIAAVNPTMLFQLIQLEQQRLALGSQNNLANLAHNSFPPCSGMPLPTPPSTRDNVSTISGNSDQQPSEKPQNSGKGSLKNAESDWGIARMKPRDPRRILQNKVVQKTEGFEPDQLRKGGVPVTPNVDSSRESIPVLGQSEQAETSLTSLPDIGLQFTKTLKKVADIVSNPQFESTSQYIPSNTPQVDGRVMENPSDEQNAPRLMDGGSISCQTQSPWGGVEKLFEKYDDQQKAVFQRERARRIEEQKKMFVARKLCLVLDLDHTLLNSAKFVEIEPVHEEILRKKEEIDREKADRHLFRFSHMSMWTKLRPGIWNFLEKASKLFELHLYTMGNKLYATEMAKILDPTGGLFSGRVISRGDDGETVDGDERLPKSKDLDGVLGMESAVVIIDDSIRVWPHNRHNLILVERYTYFPCSRRQFGLLGPSLLEIDHDERPEDGTLASSLAVIERIHQNFFSQPSLEEVDVRSILAAEQRKILSGCRILFSRIFPVGEANPHLHPLWQTAEQFGAVCTNQIDEQVTHVVANSLGTDKVNWALTKGRFVVHPGWVEASALLYRRASERDFAVKQ